MATPAGEVAGIKSIPLDSQSAELPVSVPLRMFVCVCVCASRRRRGTAA